MITALQDWKGTVEVDGIVYDSVQSFISGFKPSNNAIHIKLHPICEKGVKTENTASETYDKTYRITVKKYMTEKSVPGFDFMARWNNDNPMPLRTMTGTIEKETRGMVYMKLHGVGEATVNCICCGKELNNPISRQYGIGPICMAKVGIVADIEDVDTIKACLTELTWEGWVVKSAITESEEV